MIIGSHHFPYPVLSELYDDFTKGSFKVSLDHTKDADFFYFEISTQLKNVTIDDLIQRNLASIVVHIECKQNFFCNVYKTKSLEYSIKIPSYNLIGKIEISPFVIADVDLENYQPVDLHEDYKGGGLNILAGDVLALDTTSVFRADVYYDPLKNRSSILDIQSNKDQREGEFSLEFNGNRLIAYLSKEDHDRYRTLKGEPRFSSLLENQVIVPVMMEAVTFVKNVTLDSLDRRDEYMELAWFRSIKKKLEDLNFDVASEDFNTLTAVQKMLALPLRRSLEKLLNLTVTDY